MAKLLTFTIDFAFFARLFGGTLVYHRSPLSWRHLGNGVPKNIWRNDVPRVPRSPSTTPLTTAVIFKSKNYHISAMHT